MSLLLLIGRKIQTVAKTEEIPRDYAIWAHHDTNSQEQKSDDSTLNKQLETTIKNQIHIPEEKEVQFDNNNTLIK